MHEHSMDPHKNFTHSIPEFPFIPFVQILREKAKSSIGPRSRRLRARLVVVHRVNSSRTPSSSLSKQLMNNNNLRRRRHRRRCRRRFCL